MSEIKYCNGCGNHCPVDNLKCGRGQALVGFSKENNHPQMKTEEKCDGKKIIDLFREIGHELHFNSEGRGGQKRILIMLNKNDAISQSEFTKILSIKPGSASEILGKLENKNLIKRIPSKLDNRTTIIKITEEGKKEAQIAKEEQKIFYKKMLEPLTPEEKNILLELLKKVNLNNKNSHQEVKHHHKHHSHHDNKNN